jgi:hypothetical protein
MNLCLKICSRAAWGTSCLSPPFRNNPGISASFGSVVISSDPNLSWPRRHVYIFCRTFSEPVAFGPPASMK